ncbi:hypothetical protein [Mangrovihabitans endophyticus]|uniref:Uncharacterized protein n=1 Tax=Mangrovihabitans endophyticus TaxID=1751298 RepID=A0A8J3C8K9_9ACTN|nr:hypothetical protein [Mangrovihabitans endophyticus]GGL20093.1 hypothetical protein GCM10012284_63370 [Mangrovihabitans endophyticus]
MTLSSAVEAFAAAAAVTYRLVGTAAARIQGVDLPTADVDVLLADRAGVDAFAATLADFACHTPPTWMPAAQQYYARFDVCGTPVELSTVERPTETDTVECAGQGPWRHYVLVDLAGHAVPAVRPELRLASELVRDRPDRYEPLIDHMLRHGADVQLTLRAARERGVDPALQEYVADRLSD